MPRPRSDGTAAAPARKHKLNNLFVAALRGEATAYAVWDTLLAGFAVRIQPSGHKAWKVVYSFEGSPRWVHIGNAASIGLADARKIAADVLLDAARGGDPLKSRKRSPAGMTFETLAEIYRVHSSEKNKSWKQAHTLVSNHLIPKLGKKQASEITRADIRALFDSISAKILANGVLASASAIFSHAINREIAGVTINPCSGVERNPTKSRDRVLSDEEIKMFWEKFSFADNAGRILKVILLTGQRPGEVLAMNRSHIAADVWELPGDPMPNWPGTKNGQTHRAYLPPHARGIIDETTSPLVFANSRGTVFQSLPEIMADICKTLEAPRATPHDLRRTHGTMITSLGFGRDAMNRIQNHKDGGIANVYDRHQYAEENKKIMLAVEAKILGLVGTSAK